MISAFGVCDNRGNVARIIGTAPRNPTQEMNIFSCILIFDKLKEIKTLNGLAKNIKNNEINSPGPITGIILEGIT